VQRTLAVRPVGGMWTYDPAQEVPEGASPDMLNFQVFGGVLRKRPGYMPYTIGSFPDERATGLYSTHDDTGTVRLYMTGATKVWRYNATNKNWEAMTGPALTGGTRLFSFTVYASNLLFSQGVDNIMSLPLNGTVYAALSASSFPSRYLANFNRRVYAAFTNEGGTDKPYRIRWSANDAPTDWTGVGSGFIDRNDDPYFIRNIRKLMTTLAVYTEKSIWLAQTTGSALNPASYDRIVDDIGLAMPFSLQGRNTTQFFVGPDDFYVLNGTQSVALATAVRSRISKVINPSGLDLGFGVIDVNAQEYLVFYVSGTASVPLDVWVVNWEAKAVYPWLLNTGFTCGATHKALSGVTIAELVGTIAQQNWVLSDPAFSAQNPFVLTADTTGRVYYWSNAFLSDNGVAIRCRWRSRDYTAKDIDPTFAGEMVTMKAVGLSILDPGSSFTLSFYFSGDGGVTWSAPINKAYGGAMFGMIFDDTVSWQVTGPRVCFKIENNTNNECPQIVAFYITLERKQQSIARLAS